jgi:Carboxypeptidase regulatory-like domain
MTSKEKWIIGLALLLILAAIIIITILKHKPDQSFTTTVSVESGTVEVRSGDVSERLKAGDESVVEGRGGAIKVTRKMGAIVQEEDTTTFTIAGRVEDDAGNLISDAAIKLYKSTHPDSSISKTISTLDGTFELDDLKPNNIYTLLAEHTNYFPEKIEHIDSATSGLVITFQTGVTVSGKVVDYDNNVVSVAKIQLRNNRGVGIEEHSNNEFLPSRIAMSNNEGLFSFQNVLPGEFKLKATAKGYFPSFEGQLWLGEDKNSAEVIVLVLRSPSSIAGVVVNEEYNPIQGASLLIIQEVFPGKPISYAFGEAFENTTLFEKWTAQSGFTGLGKVVLESKDRSDSEGIFKITVSGKGDYKLIAQHPDYGACQPHGVFIEGGESVKDVTLVLSEIVTSISGYVEDENHHPVEGAQAKLTWLNTDNRNYMNDVTDTEGLFHFSSMPYGKFHITVTKDNHQTHYKTTLSITEGNPHHEVDIVLANASLSIAGKIMIRPGDPLKFNKPRNFYIEMTLRNSTEFIWRNGYKIQGDDEGNFVISDIKPGVYSIKVKCDITGQEGNSYTCKIDNVEAGTSDLNIIFIPEVTTLQGTLIDAETHKPISSASIKLIKNEWDYEQNCEFSSLYKWDVEPKNGFFAIDYAPLGVYEIHFSAKNYSPKIVKGIEIKAGAAADIGTIELVKSFTVSGKVIDYLDGSPVQGARIRLDSRANIGAKAISSDDGSFVLEGLYEGLFYLNVRHSEYATIQKQIAIDRSDASQELTIEVNQGASISGVVARPDGTPIPNAELRNLYHYGSGRNEYYHRMNVTKTNEEGFYQFAKLSIGENLIICKNHTKTFMLEAEQDIVANFVIVEGHTLSGKITARNYGEKPLAIKMSTGNGRISDGFYVYSVFTNSDGEFSVPNVPPGKYILSFTRSGEYGESGEGSENKYYYTQHIEINEQDEKITITTENVMFSGNLKNNANNPVKLDSLKLELLGDPTCSPDAYVWGSGSFSFGRIAPGLYKLFADDKLIKQIKIPEGEDLTDVVITVEK